MPNQEINIIEAIELHEIKAFKTTKIPIEQDTKANKIKKRLKELLLVTTVHGIQNTLRTERLLLKLMWTFFLISSTTLGSYYIIDSTFNYLKYNTVTTINVIDEKQAEFPTITFCTFPNVNISVDKTILRLRFDRIDDLDINKYFEEFHDPVYGKCMRYNSGINNYNQSYELLKSTKSKNNNGLKIDMNIEVPKDYDFVSTLVSIHNVTSPLYELNSGSSISTGSWNYFQIERVFSQHLGEPYSNCLKDITSFKRNKKIIEIINSSKRTYSQDDCYYICARIHALEESNCGCNSTLSNFDKDCVIQWFEKPENDTKKCVTDYLSDFRKSQRYDKCSKFCPLECDSIIYTITSDMEAITGKGNISDNVRNYYPYFKNYNTYEDINKNYVGIRVFYKDLKYTLISQEPKTETFNFVSNIGGILGLFLGLSFLSFVEIIEIFFEIFFILIY